VTSFVCGGGVESLGMGIPLVASLEVGIG